MITCMHVHAYHDHCYGSPATIHVYDPLTVLVQIWAHATVSVKGTFIICDWVIAANIMCIINMNLQVMCVYIILSQKHPLVAYS